jgi:putative sterol carrier protein
MSQATPITFPENATSWADQWQQKLAADDEYSDVAEGWGVDFDGDLCCVVEPDDAYDGAPICCNLELVDGTCHEAAIVDECEDYGFKLSGSYSSWKRLLQGEIGAVDGIMTGEFELDGDMQLVMQYTDAAVRMTELAAEIDVDFEY